MELILIQRASIKSTRFCVPRLVDNGWKNRGDKCGRPESDVRWFSCLSFAYSLLTVNRLYCSNLPDKLKKPDIKLALYTLFSTYGTVLDVVAMKTEKMRGQAHIVFRDIQTSTQAMRALQGFNFFGKDMVCDYSR